MKKTTVLAALMALVLVACDMGLRLETRTFRVENLEAHEVSALIDPYVYGSRESNPGAMSVLDGAITVRETSDNLDRIASVLSEFDQPQPDVRLHFQLIEADGFTDSDPRIAQVEDELRKLFQFQGYRLAGEATVTATHAAEFRQGLRSSDELFELRGALYRAGGQAVRLSEVSLTGEDGWSLETSVNIRPGQTIVLGSQPKGQSGATLFLTVRAQAEEGPA